MIGNESVEPKQFLLLMKQQGRGCNYTIGCGYKYIFLGSVDKESAMNEVETILDEMDALSPMSDVILEKADIVEFKPVCMFEVEKVREQRLQKMIEREKEATEQKERELLKQLKEKYKE